MKQFKVFGVLFVFSLTLAVSFDSYGGTIEKPTCEVAVILVDDMPDFTPIDLGMKLDILKPIPVAFDVSLPASPFSLTPIGKPKTKFREQKYFYPLKLC